MADAQQRRLRSSYSFLLLLPCLVLSQQSATGSPTGTPSPSSTLDYTPLSLSAATPPFSLDIATAYNLHPSLGGCGIITLMLAGGAGGCSAVSGVHGGGGAQFNISFLLPGYTQFGVAVQGGSSETGAAPASIAGGGGGGGSGAAVYILDTGELLAVAGGGGGCLVGSRGRGLAGGTSHHLALGHGGQQQQQACGSGGGAVGASREHRRRRRVTPPDGHNQRAGTLPKACLTTQTLGGARRGAPGVGSAGFTPPHTHTRTQRQQRGPLVPGLHGVWACKHARNFLLKFENKAPLPCRLRGLSTTTGRLLGEKLPSTA